MDGDVEAETHHLMVKPLSPSCLPGASRGLCAAIKQGGWGEAVDPESHWSGPLTVICLVSPVASEKVSNTAGWTVAPPRPSVR